MEITKRSLITFICFSVFVFSACGSSDSGRIETSYQPVKGSPVDGVRIGWDYSSLQCLSEKGGYPRSTRLHDHSVVAVYEDYETGYVMRRSMDDGVTWNTPITLFHSHNFTNERGTTWVHIANPEIVQLINGDLLAACNYRPETPEIAPFSITIRRSMDNGVTWSDPQVIYEAQPRFTDGCWEPSFLQLPNGDVQVYFANEGPYTHSNEQEISMLTSLDNGKTWGGFKTICFRVGSRDGMPVSKVLGDEIVCIIEDCGFVTFKPYTVRTKITDNWSSPVSADSPDRNKALGDIIEDWVYMGAPYLGALPTGETLLSYQVDDSRHTDQSGDRVPYSTMEVAIGNKNARNFTRRTRPFPVGGEKHAIWPSVTAWDANTVVALASSNYQGGIEAPCFIKGYVMRDMRIDNTSITEYPIFIGHYGKSNLCAGAAKDNSNLYVTCKVKDTELISGKKGTQSGSGVFLYLDTKNGCLKEPAGGVYKIWCSYTGDVVVWEGNRGEWKLSELKGLVAVPSFIEGGYQLAFAIPLKDTFSKQGMRIGVALSTKTYTETLVHCDANRSCTWIKMTF